jgi:cathepsin A (carboxypeptidase C)
MKLTASLSLLLGWWWLLGLEGSASAAGSTERWLRHSSSDTSASSCNAIVTADACYGSVDDQDGSACEWCIAGAIPSECMSAEQAQLLPDGVFDCSPVRPNTKTKKKRIVHFQNHLDPSSQSPVQPDYNDLCDPSSKSLSGYVDIQGSEYDQNGEDKHLFFWFFEKRPEQQQQQQQDTLRSSSSKNNSTIPFLLWLTGGPGCSSTLALLTENGPCSVNPDGASTSVNPYSWTRVAHVLWLDQPAGVGFSYGQETDTNEQMVAEDAYYFLQAFFHEYPQYASNPLFIVGESYGGHYAPAIAHRIWKGNQHQVVQTKEEEPEDLIRLNLSGLAVGNGLTDPEHQYPSYVDMATNNSHHIPLLDDTTVQAMRSVIPKCVALIQECNAGDSIIHTFACQSAFLLCNTGLMSPYQMTGLNPYDIRKPCEVPPLCYDFSRVGDFLNLESTKQALHVDEQHSHAWESCNFGINLKFHTDWMKDFSGYVADLLNDGIPALIYAGDVDYICNYLGNRAWTLALPWKGAKAFSAATEHDWKGHGLARTAQGLTFLQVYDAGHMVPTDQPAVALDMIANFMHGGTF